MSNAPGASRPVPLVGLVLCAATAVAQQAPSFREPVRMMAGEAMLGEGRLYPSPMFHDVDGDCMLDIVVGDLRGIITVARRLPGDGPARYAAEEKLKDRDGRDLDFENW